MKKIALFGIPVALFAAIAIAQPAPIAATHGRGVAENADGKRAEFRFEVRKADFNGTVRTNGNIEFNTAVGTAASARRITIRTREIMNLGVNGNVAEFGGPGVMVIRNSNGRVEEVRGRITVRVQDDVVPGQPNPNNDNDDFKITFARQNSTAPYIWEGMVKRGDIVVRTNPNP